MWNYWNWSRHLRKWATMEVKVSMARALYLARSRCHRTKVSWTLCLTKCFSVELKRGWRSEVANHLLHRNMLWISFIVNLRNESVTRFCESELSCYHTWFVLHLAQYTFIRPRVHVMARASGWTMKGSYMLTGILHIRVPARQNMAQSTHKQKSKYLPVFMWKLSVGYNSRLNI